MLAICIAAERCGTEPAVHEPKHFLRQAAWNPACDEYCSMPGSGFTLIPGHHPVVPGDALCCREGEPVATMLKRRFRLRDTELYVRGFVALPPAMITRLPERCLHPLGCA